jgi:polyhydroxyalkanoate synthesis regulator phasin
MATTFAPDFVTDTYKTMTDSFTETMRTAMKFNEETARFWTDNLTRNADEFRNRSQKLVDELAPFGKTNFERYQKNLDEQMQRTVNFFRDAMQSLQPTRPAETTERFLSMWKDQFETVRESMDTFAKANMDLAKTWTEFFQTAGANVANATAKAVNQGKPNHGGQKN